MIQRLRKAQEDRQGGFTLIELLVVILIIAILAAIAIPFFLNQREKGYRSQSQSSLKNSATSMETVAVDNNGSYVSLDGGDGADLAPFGYRETQGVTLAIDATAASYCVEATHASFGEVWSYQSANGEPLMEACP